MKNMRKKNSTKTCPFLDQQCLRTGCQTYNEILNECNISVLPYNLFRLGEVVKQFLDEIQNKE
jgi:hypothetical protein